LHTLAALCSAGHALGRLHLVDVRRAHNGFACTFGKTDERALPEHKLTAGASARASYSNPCAGDTVSVAYNAAHTLGIGEGVVMSTTVNSIEVRRMLRARMSQVSVQSSAGETKTTPREWETTNRTFALVRSVNYVTHKRLLG